MENINIGSPVPAPLVKQYSQNTPDNDFALDIGSGRGSNSLYLASKNFKVTAIDKNARALGILKTDAIKHNLDIETINQDIANLTIQENHFSFICAMNSLNFLSKKEFLEIIEKIKLGLKKDGVCVIALFTNQDSLFEEIKALAQTEDGETFFDGSGRRWYYPDKDFLRKQFENDSEILFSIETAIEDKNGHPGNESPHTHSIARIAIKKRSAN